MNLWKQKLKLRIPAIILLAITLVFWGFYDRYERIAPVLLETPALADASYQRGAVSETNGLFQLDRPVSGKSAAVHYRMETAVNYPLIRVCGRIKVVDVVEGKHPWNCARLLLVQRDETNKWVSVLHNVVSEQGSNPWIFHEEVFEMDPRSAYADLVMEQIGVSGIAMFDRLLVEPVRIRPSFVWWRIIFSTSWFFMGVLYFRRCRLHHRRLKGLILLNVLAILVGTLMPGEWIKTSVGRVKTSLAQRVERDVPPSGGVINREPVKKTNHRQFQLEQFGAAVGELHRVGHFLLFSSLCFLVYCSASLERQHPIYFIKVGFDVLLFAGITEALQHLTLDRTAGILDLRTDLYGMAMALLLFLFVRPLLLKRR